MNKRLKAAPSAKRNLSKELSDWEDWPPAWTPKAGEILVGEILTYDQGFTSFGPVRTVILKKEETDEKISLWLSSTMLLDLFRRFKPKPGERIGLKYLGKHPERGYHRYHLIVDRPETLDFSPLGGEMGAEPADDGEGLASEGHF